MFINLSLPGSLNKYDGQYEVAPEQLWSDLLKSVTESDYYFLFDVDEQPKQYIAIYLNNQKLLTLNQLHCRSDDKLMILSATSGG